MTTACGFPTSTGVTEMPVDRLRPRDDHLAEVLFENAAFEDARADRPIADDDLDPLGTRTSCEPGRGDPCPVARELRTRPVGIPDRDLDPVVRRGEHLDHAIGVARQRDGVGTLEPPFAAGLSDDVRVTERAPRRGLHQPPARPVDCHRRARSLESAASICAGTRHSDACARRFASRASARGSVASSSRPSALRAVCETGWRSASATSRTTPRRIISSVRAAILRSSSSLGSSSPTTIVGRRVASDQRRSAEGASVSPVVASSSARTTRRRSFTWTAAAAAGSSSERSACASAGPSSYIRSARARARCTCRGRDFEIRECGAEVQTGASRDHRSPRSMSTRSVDGLVREPRVLADGHRVTELADRDQVRRFGGLVGEDG